MNKTLHHYYACEIEITLRSKTFTIMSNALHLNINAKYTYKCTCPIQIQLKPLHEDFLTTFDLHFTDSDFLGVFWALRSGSEIGSYSKVCTCDLFSCCNLKYWFILSQILILSQHIFFLGLSRLWYTCCSWFMWRLVDITQCLCTRGSAVTDGFIMESAMRM